MKNTKQTISMFIKSVFAITKADLIATIKEPSALFFGMVFPLIFIVIFGFINFGGGAVKISVTPDSDMDNPIWQTIQQYEKQGLVKLVENDGAYEKLEKGRIGAIIDINREDSGQLAVLLQTSSANPTDGRMAETVLRSIADNINLSVLPEDARPIHMDTQEISGRKYTQIDFFLPGQLGLGLLSTGVMGTAFLFITLRKTLVIKRIFATPIRKEAFILGLGLSKLVFAVVQAIVIIGVGVLAFDFTLVHGFVTALEMVGLSALGLVVFLGLGFIISSMAKDTNSAAPLGNLLTVPQFLLAGSFFPIDVFPQSLQIVSKGLPLTYLNDAMRKIAFEGNGLSSVKHEILVLLVMAAVIYSVAFKVFRWED